MTAVYLDPNKSRILATIVSSTVNTPEPRIEVLIPMFGSLEATEWCSKWKDKKREEFLRYD